MGNYECTEDGLKVYTPYANFIVHGVKYNNRAPSPKLKLSEC